MYRPVEPVGLIGGQTRRRAGAHRAEAHLATAVRVTDDRSGDRGRVARVVAGQQQCPAIEQATVGEGEHVRACRVVRTCSDW